jgi:phi13 family phage major tail protein
VLKLSPKSNSDNIYSDDAVEDIITAFEGVDVEIEVNQLSLTSRAKLQGAKVVKGYLSRKQG